MNPIEPMDSCDNCDSGFIDPSEQLPERTRSTLPLPLPASGEPDPNRTVKENQFSKQPSK